MTNYTEDQHAARLLWLLENRGSKLCGTCPGTMSEDMPHRRQTICSTCLGFVGLKNRYRRPENRFCSCALLDDPVKTTWLALEAKGYLK